MIIWLSLLINKNPVKIELKNRKIPFLRGDYRDLSKIIAIKNIYLN